MPKPNPQENTQEVSPLQVRADIGAASYDPETNSFEVVFSTGARVLRMDWWKGERFWEELSLDPKHMRLNRLNNGAPVLDSHDMYSGVRGQIGVVENGSAKTDGKKATARVRFSKRADVAPIVEDVRAAIIQNVSCGYRTFKMIETEPALNREDGIAVRTAIDWEPYEISPVPSGADDGAGFRSANRAEERTNTCVLITRATETTVPPEDTQPKPAVVPAPAQVQTTEDQQRALTAAAEQARTAELTRHTEIRAAVRAAKLDESYADELCRDANMTVDKARAAVLTKLAEKDAAQPQTHGQHRATASVTEDEGQKFLQGAERWLFAKGGFSTTLRDTAGVAAMDTGNEFRGMTLADLARESLVRHNINPRQMDRMTMIGRALTLRANYQTTSDFTVLLENVMGKVLLAQYRVQPDTWSLFCKIGSLSDFRSSPRYKQGTFGRLDQILESGEFKNKPIDDGIKELIALKTYGNIIGLSRQAIINDDMGAFTDLATRLGRAAKLSVEVDVYDQLKLNAGLGPTLTSDGYTVFEDTHHKNIAAVAAAPSAVSFDAIAQLMAAQTDISGNEILDITPAIWLGPRSLLGQAKVVNDAQYDPDTPNKLQRPNISRGMFKQLIGSGRLTGTRWYALADPGDVPTFEVAFLDGQREPVLESQDGWRVDGTEWKIRFDYGTAPVEYRGAATNAGA